MKHNKQGKTKEEEEFLFHQQHSQWRQNDFDQSSILMLQ